jgi:hypothetical protein
MNHKKKLKGKRKENERKRKKRRKKDGKSKYEIKKWEDDLKKEWKRTEKK